LVRAARSPDDELRKSAVWSLTHIDQLPDGPVHDLFIEMASDESDWVRRASVQGLKNLSCPWPQDVQVLLGLAYDPDKYTRSLAIGALSSAACKTSGCLDAVMHALRDAEELVRESAVDALADYAQLPDEAAAPLGAMITDKFVSGRILPLLVRMAERGSPAVPYLAEALKHKDKAIAYNASFALSRIGKAAASAVDELSQALTHKDKFVRRYSAQALGNSGAAAVKSLPALNELKNDTDPHVSGAARRAITQIRNAN
jgi:HEAT repeat protein